MIYTPCVDNLNNSEQHVPHALKLLQHAIMRIIEYQNDIESYELCLCEMEFFNRIYPSRIQYRDNSYKY